MEHYFQEQKIGDWPSDVSDISETSDIEFLISLGRDSFESTLRDRKTLIVPDIHGDLTALKSCLKRFELLDINDNWIGGDARVVFVGDLIDRGGEDKAVLDFVIELKKIVALNGGELVVLAGNHELFLLNRLFGNMRKDTTVKNMILSFNMYCKDLLRDFDVSASSSTDRILKAFLKSEDEKYLEFLKDLKIFYKFDDVLVVHGGVAPQWANFIKENGIEAVNRRFEESFETGIFKPFNLVSAVRGGVSPIGEVSPVWFDHSDLGNGSLSDVEKERIYEGLKAEGVNLVVSGHQPDFAPRCITYTDFFEDYPLRFMCIDTYMTRGYGKVSSNGGMFIKKGVGGKFAVSDCDGKVYTDFKSLPAFKR